MCKRGYRSCYNRTDQRNVNMHSLTLLNIRMCRFSFGFGGLLTRFQRARPSMVVQELTMNSNVVPSSTSTTHFCYQEPNGSLQLKTLVAMNKMLD